MSQPLSRILVAVDFSSSSERAVAAARRLATQTGGQLDLVHICALQFSARDLPSPSLNPGVIEGAQEALGKLAAATRADGFTVEAHFAVGAAAFGILDFIRRLNPAMVVLGSHGRGAMMRLLVGSVAESVMRRSPVPVLIVPAEQRTEATDNTAWSCRDCGHIVTNFESTIRCGQCGAEPPHWNSAPISAEPIDAGLPSVSDGAREQVSGGSSAGVATSPAGSDGGDVNPELRVRY